MRVLHGTNCGSLRCHCDIVDPSVQQIEGKVLVPGKGLLSPMFIATLWLVPMMKVVYIQLYAILVLD